MALVKDKQFKLFIPQSEILMTVNEVGEQITNDFKDKQPVFIAILNGSFMFAADLLKAIKLPCQISFVKFVSYSGLTSSGKVSELIGIGLNLKDKDVIIIEDIVDTGRTMTEILNILEKHQPASISIASLLVKPDALEHEVDIAYRCFEIPNDFVVGYGLDYDGLGRNLPGIYKLDE